MIKANGRSALILTTTLATALLAGLTAPAYAASDDLNLNSPVFVAPATSGAQTSTAQPATENQVAAPDQLNDTDRALRDNAAAPISAPAASNEATPAVRSAPVMAASGEHSVWDETTLIGKIFIGFGALLTIASAARMFMA